MRKNLVQKAEKDSEGINSIPWDWFPGVIPESFTQGENSYIDSSWAFDAFFSKNREAMTLGYASAFYDRATFVTSGNGKIETGEYVILNGCTLICTDHILIGDYVMIAWGAVVTDNEMGSDLDIPGRSLLMKNAGDSGLRELPFSRSAPVIISDNVWIGFDAVVLPGTTIGRGSVIGCKSVVSGEIPEYSVVAGNPGRVIRTLRATDRF